MKQRGSLSRQVAIGGIWVFALRVLENLLRITRLVIVARFLSPHDFGLFGIALLVLSTMETFSQTGFQTALVQKPGDITPYLDTAWTVAIIRGGCLFLLLFFAAPYIASFFQVEGATHVIRLVGATLLIGALVNSGIVTLQRELDFARQFLYRLASTFIDFVVVLIAAVVMRNVWALVLGWLAGSLAGLIASYLIHPYRPRLRIEWEKARELFGFGRWISASAILVFLITQGDDALVGKFLGPTMLGFYQMAYRISNIPTTEITHVISQVTFPAYAKIQNNRPKLREAYLRVLKLTALLSFPVAGLIFVLASDFAKIFLGIRWMPIVPAMQVLAFWGLIRSLGATTGPLFVAVGRPQMATKLQLMLLFLLAIFIYPLSIKWGILGTSLAVLAASIFPNFAAFCFLKKMGTSKLGGIARVLLPPCLATLALILLIASLRAFWTSATVMKFIVSMIIGVVIYIFLIYLSDKWLATNYLFHLGQLFSYLHKFHDREKIIAGID